MSALPGGCRPTVSISLWRSWRQEHPGGHHWPAPFCRGVGGAGAGQSVSDAFHRFLDPGKPYYLSRTYLPIARGNRDHPAVRGAAVLAHPLQYGYSPAELRRLVAEAAAFGVGGMEICYTGYDAGQRGLCRLWRQNSACLPLGAVISRGQQAPDCPGSAGCAGQCLTDLKAWLGRDGV